MNEGVFDRCLVFRVNQDGPIEQSDTTNLTFDNLAQSGCSQTLNINAWHPRLFPFAPKQWPYMKEDHINPIHRSKNKEAFLSLWT